MLSEKDLPKLPHGEGKMHILNDSTVEYRKVITLPNGKKVRKAVYCETPKKCIEKMRKIEKDLARTNLSNNKVVLKDAMNNWLDNIHRQTIKPQSYQRLKTIIRNQISESDIGNMRYQLIKNTDIQAVIDDLNAKNYSHSTIKKTYDILNMFYRYASIKDHIENPMLLVNMPRVSNVLAETKEVEWFEQDDVEKFINACGAKYNNGRLKYKYGYILAANIFIGLRGGELLALQWKDIDFDKGTVYVSKTLIEYRDLDQNKTHFEIQNSTKRDKNRYVPINARAKKLLKLHYDNSLYTQPDDFVVSTSNRKTTTLKHISDVIGAIEEEGETNVRAKNTHILRHTCASLYFRAGVPVEIICQILGNSREVCEKTYIHFVEEQLKNAATKTIKAIDFF